MRINVCMCLLIGLLASVSGMAQDSPENAPQDLLTIGSDAPALDIEYWLSNGNGKFPKVTKFEPGKVYVVEFWATWCGPCIQSMPHLAQLQKEYANKGVQFISVSNEDLETVKQFLERKTPQAEAAEQAGQDPDQAGVPKTFGELTSVYCLTTDPDGSVHRAYMDAAMQNGIPTAFIVGRDGKIEWIGHPMQMDEPLAEVVAGTWDREAFGKEFRARQEAERAMQEIFQLLQQGNFDAALKKIDAVLEKNDDLQIKVLKLQVLLAAQKSDAAVAWLEKLYKDLKQQPQMINMIAWNLYQMDQAGQSPGKQVLASVEKALREAITRMEGEDKASALDTLAHLLHAAGALDEAISLERKALELAGERDREFVTEFLKQLEQEKAGGKSSAQSDQ